MADHAPVPDRAAAPPAPRLAVTAIGGGHGLARTLAATRSLGWWPTAVVSVADDGGSSGRLRRDLGVVPPGDLRMALSTLCPDPLRRALLEHRFTGGELDGHALGNLVLLAAADQRDGDLAAGLDVLSDLFGARGRVLPVSDTPQDLVAECHDGSRVRGQRRIAGTPGIARLRLADGDVAASPAARDAVRAADVVVVGPGSWFTSLLAPLIVPGLAAALAATAALTVVVANIRQQPGETEGMDMRDHVDAFFAHLPDGLDVDVLLVNDDLHPPGDGAHGHELAPIANHPRVGRVVAAPVVDDRGNHDPDLLAAALAAVVATSGPDRATGRRSDPGGPGVDGGS